jgi:hypothetical protein
MLKFAKTNMSSVLQFDVNTLRLLQVIRQNAGEIEETYSPNVTHVLCSHQHGKNYRKVT